MIEQGQRYRVVREIPVVVMTAWASPATGSHEGVLPAGELFSVAGDPSPGAKAVYCAPDDGGRLERELVPLRERVRFWSYRGFYLCIDTEDIRERCELIEV